VRFHKSAAKLFLHFCQKFRSYVLPPFPLSMANFPSPRLNAAAHGYSLIELLAVIAILSALAGLTVGSLSPVKATALTAGGNQITDLLANARQNSISRNAFTAVVIKSAGDARYSAYCLLELTRNDDGDFAAWRTLAPWRTLPAGVRFDPNAVTNPAVNFLTASPSPPFALPTSVQFRGQPINLTTDAAYQIFAPDGTLRRDVAVRLRLVEAAENLSGPGITYTGRKGTSGQPANYYDIVMLRDTGQAKVERL
jgi:prepilin-type N-terminal cleavage/methylation domain-containing protein